MAPPKELSSGAVLFRKDREHLTKQIFERLEENKLPESCVSCDLWKCNNCEYSDDGIAKDPDHCYITECDLWTCTCPIMGDDGKCDNLGQFITILLELI